MISKRWTIGAIYMALFDWSVINASIIMKDLHSGYTNRQTKEELIAQIIEKTNANAEVAKPVGTTNKRR